MTTQYKYNQQEPDPPAVESKPDEEDISDKKLIEDVKKDSEITAIMEELNKTDETLNEFLDYNLKQSKEDKEGNRMFMAGWIAALMHVKLNFADKFPPPQPLSGTTPSSGANSSFNSGEEK
jgi:hypothetical protein